MASRNERPERHARPTKRTSRRAKDQASQRGSVSRRSVRSSRNEMGRYSRYASADQRSYPSDHRSASTHRRESAAGVAGGSAGSAGAGQYSRGSAAYSHAAAKRKSGKGKKIAIGVVAVLLVALIGCGTAVALYINGINDTLRGDKSDEELAEINEQLIRTDLSQPFYMMLLGSDIREGQSQGDSRSDTNILVRVDAPNHQVTMVSIMRDTAIELDGHGVVKFNAAYSYDGAAGIIREASQLCGVEISHYAEVNFDSLVDLVDAVGGVDVEVTERIDDPDADGSWNSHVEPIIIEEGMQHLDGKAALVFARSRAYADGDYTRTQNQRKLIEAIADKVLSLPVTELPGVIEAAAQCVTTDLNVTEIISLAQMFQEGGDMTIYSAGLPSTAEYVNGISYVFVDTEGLTEMMDVVDSGGDPSTISESNSSTE